MDAEERTSGDNCIKIGPPGKSILRDYFQENRSTRRPFLLLRISFPRSPIVYTIRPWAPVALSHGNLGDAVLGSHVAEEKIAHRDGSADFAFHVHRAPVVPVLPVPLVGRPSCEYLAASPTLDIELLDLGRVGLVLPKFVGLSPPWR